MLILVKVVSILLDFRGEIDESRMERMITDI